MQKLPAIAAAEPLLPWLLGILSPMSRTRVKEWLRDGRIRVNGSPITRHDHALVPGDLVAVGEPTRAPLANDLERAGIVILHEDDDILVIEKPAGLLTVATDSEKTDTAFARLRAHNERAGKPRPFVVHRLDRETSGLLLFALSPTIRDRLQANWDSVTKTYLAVVLGSPRPPSGKIDNYLLEGRDLRVRAVRSGTPGAVRAVSRYRLISETGKRAVVEVILETGRKHQVRVHLAGLGCPILGDPIYGSSHGSARRMGLHAHRLAFNHPGTGEQLEFVSPLPDI